jgi:hypothetical protein
VIVVIKITMIVTGKRLRGLPLDVCLPLPKCGSPTGFSDFRPISILPVLSKGLERLICDQFIDYLDSGGLLSPYQSWFRKFRSNATALTKIMDIIQWRGRVLVDFSKAFDSIA